MIACYDVLNGGFCVRKSCRIITTVYLSLVFVVCFIVTPWDDGYVHCFRPVFMPPFGADVSLSLLGVIVFGLTVIFAGLYFLFSRE